MEALDARVRLTADDERKLHWKMTRGPHAGRVAARNRLIEANLPLAVWWAKREYKKHMGSNSYLGLELEDLVQEANMGLVYAIDRYDPRKGRISTYVSFRIRQCLRRAIAEKSTVVRTPVSAYVTTAPLLGVEHKFVAEHGRAPTNKELADLLGWRETHVERAWAALSARHGTVTIDALDVDFLARQASLRQELPQDEDYEAPEGALSDADSDLFDMALQALNELPERLRAILCAFGRGDSTYVIGDNLGISHERVRQLVAEARNLVIHSVERLRGERLQGECGEAA